MKTKLLFILTLLVSSFTVNAQEIGFLGDFNGWGDDVNMTTTDNINYTLSTYYLPDTSLKFRQDDDWANSWGGDTFPNGTWSGDNIPVTAGFYDISINIATTEYAFTAVTPTNQNVSIIGEFNSWAGDVALSTTDNITYTATDVALTAGGLKFRRDANWSVNFGGTALTGTAVPASADNIAIPSNVDYDISFNIETLAYTITESSLSTDVFEAKNSFKIIKGHLYTSKSEKISISIYTINGQLVRSIKNYQAEGSSTIDLDLNRSTLYFVTIKTNDGLQTIKTMF
ncbi:T9SS type A sorting domain-containing protein [Lacinutrix sp. MEBiC02404]